MDEIMILIFFLCTFLIIALCCYVLWRIIKFLVQKKNRRIAIAVLSLSAIGVCFLVSTNWINKIPLTKDVDIIKHFNEHRADIEELVHRYRYFDQRRFAPFPLWTTQEGTKELLDRAGVRDISKTSGLGTWLENPYSDESIQKLKEFREQRRTDMENYAKYGREQKAPFHESSQLNYKYGVLRIKLKNEDGNYYDRPSFYPFTSVWKDLYHFPEAPRVENGVLITTPDTWGPYARKRRVLDSLDYNPDNWRSYECVYRRIEPKWFINLCRSR